MQILDIINTAARAAEGFADGLRHAFTSAVILAGGTGTRMGAVGPDGRPLTKQFMELDGEPVILRTIRQFDRASCIDELILVIREEEKTRYPALLRGAGLQKPVKLTVGGATRQESAEAGLRAVSDKCRFLAIHDGARPLITPAQIEAVAKEAYRIGAAAAASRAKDTVKLTDGNGFVEQTPDRENVWNAATPQIFKVEEYRAAVYEGKQSGVKVTDDCSLAEAVGFPVRMVDVGYQNLKITTKEDLAFAHAILALRAEEAEKTERSGGKNV